MSTPEVVILINAPLTRALTPYIYLLAKFLSTPHALSKLVRNFILEYIIIIHIGIAIIIFFLQ